MNKKKSQNLFSWIKINKNYLKKQKVSKKFLNQDIEEMAHKLTYDDVINNNF